ncbi:MAG: hypothetical protein ACK578_22430 [Pirellula sp.]
MSSHLFKQLGRANMDRFHSYRSSYQTVGLRAKTLSRLCWSIAGVIVLVESNSVQCFAEEPSRRFLERLKQERMFEVGLKYLELAEKRDRLPDSFKADLAIERILLEQESLPNLKSPKLVEERMTSIESGLKSFIESSPKHPRRSEAQTRLGDVLRSRAEAAIEESEAETNQTRVSELKAKARQWFLDANKLYVSINEELKPILEGLAGNRAQSEEEIQLREKYRADYRQAEILQAKTLEFVSQTYDKDSAEWRSWLEKSEKKLSEIVDKTSGAKEAGRRMLSLLYRAQVQAKLGKWKEARESFTRVADVNEGGIFRTWKIESIAGLIRLDLLDSPPKYEPAIQRGVDALKSASNQEKSEPHWIDLQMALVEARIAWGKTLDEKKDDGLVRSNRRDTREILQYLFKIRGPHQELVKKQLAAIGLDSVAQKETDEKFPEPKNFEEAIAQARNRLDRAENAEKTLSLAKDEESRSQIMEAIANDRTQAIVGYQKSLRLYSESDSREDLVEAKYLIAYLYLRTEQYWQALALSQAIVRTDRGTDKAQKSGGFALVALTKLIASRPEEEKAALLPALESLAKNLLDTAPGSEESKNALDTLIKLAIINKQYDKAVEYVKLGGNRGSGASILGQLFWRDYQLNLIQHKKNKTPETDDDRRLKQQAEELLKATWDALDPDQADAALISGVNALANLYLMSDRLADAKSVIDDPKKGAIVLVKANGEIEKKDILEAYKLQLQSMVQSAGSQGGTPLEAVTVTSIVDRMKSLSAGQDVLLTNALRSLASSIGTKIESTKDIGEQAKLGNALAVLVQQLVSVTSDIGILDSAGSSVLESARNLAKLPGLAEQSKTLMAVAEQAYSKIASATDEELKAANRNPLEVRIRLAMSKTGVGKCEESHQLYLDMLSKSPKNLSIQMEAARNLQAWSGSKDTALLKRAWAGSDPNTNKENIIWGWNKIAQMTGGKINDFKEAYFEARSNLALCIRLEGLASQNPEVRQKQLNKSTEVIRGTRLLQPELGTPEFKQKFELLETENSRDLNR